MGNVKVKTYVATKKTSQQKKCQIKVNFNKKACTFVTNTMQFVTRNVIF